MGREIIGKAVPSAGVPDRAENADARRRTERELLPAAIGRVVVRQRTHPTVRRRRSR